MLKDEAKKEYQRNYMKAKRSNKGSNMSGSNSEGLTRIDMIKQGTNPSFVMELETGYVVLGDFQFYEGYALFLCKEHVKELHDLKKDFKEKFLIEMSIVAEAVFKAFKPKKINYELLGNSDSHLHWHIFPRYSDDPSPEKPVWCLDKEIRYSEQARPSKEELNLLKKTLLKELTS